MFIDDTGHQYEGEVWFRLEIMVHSKDRAVRGDSGVSHESRKSGRDLQRGPTTQYT